MKKYRLTDKATGKLAVGGKLPDGRYKFIGMKLTDEGIHEGVAEFVMFLITEGHIKGVREAIIYAFKNYGFLTKPSLITLSGETWPIELGLVEEEKKVKMTNKELVEKYDEISNRVLQVLDSPLQHSLENECEELRAEILNRMENN